MTVCMCVFLHERMCASLCVSLCASVQDVKFNPVTIHLSDRASESSHVMSDACCSKEATFLSTQNVNKPKTKYRPDIVVSSLYVC